MFHSMTMNLGLLDAKRILPSMVPTVKLGGGGILV